jgi:hypothetical protein
MADRVLFIGWNQPSRGAEERAIEAFNEAVGLMGRMQHEGRIDSFEVVLLSPNGELGGYFTIRGSADQINALREDDEFQRSTVKAQLAVDGIRHIVGSTGAGVAHQMDLYREEMASVPQHA